MHIYYDNTKETEINLLTVDLITSSKTGFFFSGFNSVRVNKDKNNQHLYQQLQELINSYFQELL